MPEQKPRGNANDCVLILRAEAMNSPVQNRTRCRGKSVRKHGSLGPGTARLAIVPVVLVSLE